jgi:Spy/CpxP family protein refolding chaperone
MTKTVKRILLGVGTGLIALGITAGAYAFAQNTNQDPGPFTGRGMMRPGGPGRGGPGGPMGMLPMLGRRLGLTDTQRDQIKNIVSAHRDEWKALAGRAMAAHRALHEAVTADAIDDSLVRQRSADVALVDADVAVARAHAHAEVLQLLTADQKAQLKTMQSEMKNRPRRGRQ